METIAADGYILDSTPHEVKLRYDDDTPEVVVYELNITNKPTEPKLPQTGDDLNLWFFSCLGLGIMVAGFLIYMRRKKNSNS